MADSVLRTLCLSLEALRMLYHSHLWWGGALGIRSVRVVPIDLIEGWLQLERLLGGS